MKMGLFRLHKKHLVALVLLICLTGLSMFRLASATAKPEQGRPTPKTAPTKTPDANSVSTDSEPDEKTPPPAASDPNESDDDIFDLKLSSFVLINEAYDRIFTPELITAEGLVKYGTLKRKRLDVLEATRELKNLNPAVMMALSKEERMAFWINTYNFCTIELILRHYPIQPKWYMIIYPDNSIMQITGAWTKEIHKIQRQEYYLQEIEQDFLLKRYKDPRICFALSNASIGGATMRNERYTANRLDEQLNDQVEKYLKTHKGLHWSDDNKILFLSNIFQTHTKTFLDSDLAAIKKFRQRKDEERVWFNFIRPYLSKEEALRLESEEIRVKFIEFDWHLNEKK